MGYGRRPYVPRLNGVASVEQLAPVVLDVETLVAVVEPRAVSPEARRLFRIERDGPECVWCGAEAGRFTPLSTEHVIPKHHGGISMSENEVNACEFCNSRRNHLLPLQYLDECRSRGLQPKDAVVLGAVMRLDRVLRGRSDGLRELRRAVSPQIRRLEGHPGYVIVGDLG
jgi:HNH endonuclease